MNELGKASIAVLLTVLVVVSLGCIESPNQGESAQGEVGHYCSYDPNYGYIYVVYSEDETNRSIVEVHIDRNLYNQAPKKYWANYEAKHGIKIKPLTPEEIIKCLN